MPIFTKEAVLSKLQETSQQIAGQFDKQYNEYIENLAEELAISFENLNNIVNREDQSKISDADFQSALLFWTALNTFMSAIELFRRGYPKEPQMLMRNIIEIFSSAYDIHANPKKLDVLMKTPKNFDSTKSIAVAKGIHPVIGNMYGILSNSYSHVSLIHTIPHKSQTPLCIGGLYDPSEQKYNLFTISIFMLTLDVLNGVMEFTFYDEISNHRHWTKLDDERMHFSPIPVIKTRGMKLVRDIQELLLSIKEEI